MKGKFVLAYTAITGKAFVGSITNSATFLTIKFISCNKLFITGINSSLITAYSVFKKRLGCPIPCNSNIATLLYILGRRLS